MSYKRVLKWKKSKQKGYHICPVCGEYFGETLKDLELYQQHFRKEHMAKTPILTVNLPETGKLKKFKQRELERTQSILESFSLKYPDAIDYWILDARGVIDTAGIRKNKTFFLAEFKHFEKNMERLLRLKWSELLILKAGNIPVFGWIRANGTDFFIYVSPDAIDYSVDELLKKSEEKTESGKERRTSIAFFDSRCGDKLFASGNEIAQIVTVEQAIDLLKKEVDKH